MAENKETNTVSISEILETFFNKGEKTEPKFKSLEELAISVANKFKNNRKGGDDSSEIEYVTHKCIIFDNYQQYKEFKKNDKTGCNGWSNEFKEFIDDYNEHVLEQGYLPEGINSVDDLIQYCKETYPQAIESGVIPENVSLELYTDMILDMCEIIQPDKWNTNCWNCIGKVSVYNGREGFFVGTSNCNNCEIINDPYMLTFDEYFNQTIQMMLQEYHMTYDEFVEMVIQQIGSWDVFVEIMREQYENNKYDSISNRVLFDCINCIDCLSCETCRNCKKCNNCKGDSENIFSNCENCMDCNNCENCINTNSSNYCKNCINCGSINEGGCNNCNDCNGCLRCNDCNKCINCLECDYCESCSVCNHCNNCLECVKCEGCNKCYDCKETIDIENSQCMYKNWYKSEVFNQ